MAKIRITNQPAIILHQYAYSETSLILDVFTKNFGRISVIAKGAKRPHSALRSVLHLFQPLIISYSGAGEVKTLTQAEWINGILAISPKYFISAFYMNELIRESCAKEDAHEKIFDAYITALSKINHQYEINHILREFEKILLTEMGFGIHWQTSWLDEVPDSQLLVYQPKLGFKLSNDSDYTHLPCISKKGLLSFLNSNYSVEEYQVKHLLRFMIAEHFSKQLKTRKIMQDLAGYMA